MNSKKMTHAGVLYGDARARIKAYRTLLRETKKHWITDSGTKYRKADGSQPGVSWPIYYLDLDTVERLED